MLHLLGKINFFCYTEIALFNEIDIVKRLSLLTDYLISLRVDLLHRVEEKLGEGVFGPVVEEGNRLQEVHVLAHNSVQASLDGEVEGVLVYAEQVSHLSANNSVLSFLLFDKC